jgi:hypothetical protein
MIIPTTTVVIPTTVTMKEKATSLMPTKTLCQYQTTIELTLINQQRISIYQQLALLIKQQQDLLLEEHNLAQKQQELLLNLFKP